MAEIKADTLCKYCFGCNKLEMNFEGTRRCNNFIGYYSNWQELYENAIRERLKKK